MGSWPRSREPEPRSGDPGDTESRPSVAAQRSAPTPNASPDPAPLGAGAAASESQGRGPGSPIHVVAGVITDVRGRILLARRTRGRDLAGLWEFPGGKVDPGETAEQALVRELREELGIEATVGEPLIAVPHRYPHKRLRLDVRRVAAYRGTPRGLDGQALAWVPPSKLGSYPMPAADLPVVAALQQPDRYLVTPGPQAGGERVRTRIVGRCGRCCGCAVALHALTCVFPTGKRAGKISADSRPAVGQAVTSAPAAMAAPSASA